MTSPSSEGATGLQPHRQRDWCPHPEPTRRLKVPPPAGPAGSSRTKTTVKSTRQPVRPVRPVAPYVGGKRNLARQIIERIEATPHARYAEAFVGMGGIFLRRAERPAFEVINDWSADVANLFRILREHYPQFMEVLRFQITTRHEFDRLSKVDPATLTDLQRAARFLYLQRVAFGGRVAERHFGMDMNRARFDLTKLQPMLEDLHERLAGVVIEQLPFERFIARYDSPETLIYYDPPYWGTEDYYGAALFQRSDFERLSGALKAIRGRFIVSLNDVPEIREIFAWASIEGVELNYRLSGRPTPAREVIISTPV